MPDNFQPKDRHNPYADYDSKLLYQFMREHGVAKPARTQFLYSNLGLGLLGQALANRVGADYAALLKRSVLDPLGMQHNYAGIVLVNMTLSPRGSFADTVGKHIGARFAGEKAVSLGDG